MSVTSPTLKLLALDDPELVELLDPPLAALELVLLLLLLPHAATTRAAATAATARRPKGLILPDTKSPFLHNRMGNLIRCGGLAGTSPNVLFTHGQHRSGPGGAYPAESV
jgi:hypothetical protein